MNTQNLPSVFTGKWFTGRVKVLSINGNDLKVELTKLIDGANRFSTWTETWNLQHTIWGFESGDYFSPKPDYFKNYPTEDGN